MPPKTARDFLDTSRASLPKADLICRLVALSSFRRSEVSAPILTRRSAMVATIVSSFPSEFLEEGIPLGCHLAAGFPGQEGFHQLFRPYRFPGMDTHQAGHPISSLPFLSLFCPGLAFRHPIQLQGSQSIELGRQKMQESIGHFFRPPQPLVKRRDFFLSRRQFFGFVLLFPGSFPGSSSGKMA